MVKEMLKEIEMKNGLKARMSLEMEANGIYHGGAGFINGSLYTGVTYHLTKKDYENLLNNLELFIRLFAVITESNVRHIKLMDMVLMSDNGFHWELVSRTTDEK